MACALKIVKGNLKNKPYKEFRKHSTDQRLTNYINYKSIFKHGISTEKLKITILSPVR